MSVPTPEPLHLEPVADDGVRALQVGLGLWAAAGLVLLLQRDALVERGTQWWLAVCGAGLLFGLGQLVIFSRRRARIRTREARVDAGQGPSGAGPTG